MYLPQHKQKYQLKFEKIVSQLSKPILQYGLYILKLRLGKVAFMFGVNIEEFYLKIRIDSVLLKHEINKLFPVSLFAHNC